jgi:phage replication O-like protein O
MSMSNVLKIADFQRAESPDQGVEVRKVADCDNGYTRIANELLDALLAADLTKHQYKVALAIVRKTYGFNKSFDRITNSQIAELANLPETRVCTAKNQLLDMQIITMQGRKIGPNKVLSEWELNIPQNREEIPETGCKSFPETGNTGSPKQGNTKDTIQKTRKTTTDGVSAIPQQPSKKVDLVVECQAAVDEYHRQLPNMPAVRELTDSRKTKLRNFWRKFQFTTERWSAYLEYVATNCRWMCEHRPRRDGESQWKPKNFDYLITERCYLAVREGRFDD